MLEKEAIIAASVRRYKLLPGGEDVEHVAHML